MLTTNDLQICRHYAAISCLVQTMMQNPFQCIEFCRLLYLQHVDFAMMHHNYASIVSASVRGHDIGLDDGAYLRLSKHVDPTSQVTNTNLPFDGRLSVSLSVYQQKIDRVHNFLPKMHRTKRSCSKRSFAFAGCALGLMWG